MWTKWGAQGRQVLDDFYAMVHRAEEGSRFRKVLGDWEVLIASALPTYGGTPSPEILKPSHSFSD